MIPCLGAAGADAQNFPVKPIRIVVPFAPGGPADLHARIIGQKLTQAWGQQTIVDNRRGGGTVIGTIIPPMPHIKAGRLRALAVTGARRAQRLPDVPTVAESLPGYEANGWHGVLVPGTTPKALIAKLNQEIARGLHIGDARARLADEATEVVGGSPEQFGVFLKVEIEKWAKVIRAAGIRRE